MTGITTYVVLAYSVHIFTPVGYILTMDNIIIQLYESACQLEIYNNSKIKTIQNSVEFDSLTTLSASNLIHYVNNFILVHCTNAIGFTFNETFKFSNHF